MKFSATFFLMMLSLCVTFDPDDGSAEESITVWIGTSSARPSRGIYRCTLNTTTGKLSNSELVAEIDGPGFLALHPDGTHLYAVGTLQQTPCVACYRIEGERLQFINSVAVGDGGATHLSVDLTGRLLLTAQYGGGSTAAFAISPTGALDRRTMLIKHEGGSRVVPGRQEKPHAHYVGFSPDQRFALVPDLGLDQVLIYRVDVTKGLLEPHGAGNVPPGGGPRHMKFHTSGKWAYVLNELDLSVTVFDYDSDQATLTPKQTIPTVTKEELAKLQFSSASEIRVHPSGRFVYAANRGHDTITAFAVDPDDGRLTTIGLQHIRGATPRNFNIDPSGKWLLAAGQDSHTLASFAINQTTGELTYNQSVISTPAPICVLFGHEQ